MYTKMESGELLKWPNKDTKIDAVLEGPVVELKEGKFGGMCFVAAPDGKCLIAGKNFYSKVSTVDEDHELTWKINVGDRLRLTFKGLKPTDKGNPLRLIDVECDPA